MVTGKGEEKGQHEESHFLCSPAMEIANENSGSFHLRPFMAVFGMD